jgi:hypothetical protein
LAAVFGDADRPLDQFDLRHDLRGRGAGREVAAADGAARQTVFVYGIDVGGIERRPKVGGVARLGPALPRRRRLRLRRLDDVAGRWLGRVRRILAGSGQLGFQARDASAQLPNQEFEFLATRTYWRRDFHDPSNLRPKPLPGQN